MEKTYLQQFYKLNITKLDGTLYDKEETAEEMKLLSSCLHLDYCSPKQCVLKFVIFHMLTKETKQFKWFTTPVVSINEDGELLIVTTQNSIYRFEKTNEDPFETLSKALKSRMSA